MIVITVQQPGSEPVTDRFDIDRIRIGREADNDLVLESDSCSRYHAEILLGRGVYKIVDLNSTNGISVNSTRVQEQLIANGDSVEIGVYTLSLSIPQEETPKTTMMSMADVAPKPEEPKPEPPPKVLYLNRLIGRGGESSLKMAEGVEYSIGRSPGADMVVDDAQCSGRHAVVILRGDRCTVRDLDSANGTFVNGEQVDQAEIRPGDRLMVGRTEFAISEQPPQTADKEILLARTQRGFTIPGHEQSAADRDNAVRPRTRSAVGPRHRCCRGPFGDCRRGDVEIGQAAAGDRCVGRDTGCGRAGRNHGPGGAGGVQGAGLQRDRGRHRHPATAGHRQRRGRGSCAFRRGRRGFGGSRGWTAGSPRRP